MNKFVAWTDSSIVLKQICEDDHECSFLRNCISKIHEKRDVTWKYVNTAENPAVLENCNMLLAKMAEVSGNSVNGGEALKGGQVISRKKQLQKQKRRKES